MKCAVHKKTGAGSLPLRSRSIEAETSGREGRAAAAQMGGHAEAGEASEHHRPGREFGHGGGQAHAGDQREGRDRLVAIGEEGQGFCRLGRREGQGVGGPAGEGMARQADLRRREALAAQRDLEILDGGAVEIFLLREAVIESDLVGPADRQTADVLLQRLDLVGAVQRDELARARRRSANSVQAAVARAPKLEIAILAIGAGRVRRAVGEDESIATIGDVPVGRRCGVIELAVAAINREIAVLDEVGGGVGGNARGKQDGDSGSGNDLQDVLVELSAS